LEKRRIGNSGLEIAPLMLGGNVFGWTADREASFAVLDAFVDAGYNAIDTADVYSCWAPGNVGGESETVIGEWLHSRQARSQVVIATKIGGVFPDWSKGNLSKTHIIQGVEASLNRLQTDYIDLYQSHVDDPVTPLDETLEAYDRLIQAGKVRTIGASYYSPARLGDAVEASAKESRPRYECMQTKYNLMDRNEFEGPLRDVCIDHGVGVTCMTSLAKGFLTGKYRSADEIAKSAWASNLQRYATERGARVLAALHEVASPREAGLGEVALAWLMAQPGVTAAIVAVDDVAQLREIIGAGSLQLSADELALLTDAGAL